MGDPRRVDAVLNNLTSSLKIILRDKNDSNVFVKSQVESHKKSIEKFKEQLNIEAVALAELIKLNSKNKEPVLKIINLSDQIANEKSYDTIADYAVEIKDLLSSVVYTKLSKLAVPDLNLPDEIKEYVYADIDEIKKCFDSECYRSVMILCGRLIEVALHRKYFEATGKDILEDYPGIGLGKLYSKLNETGIELRPGIDQQIHLVNMVRISSVHKKKDDLAPSKEQAHATFLFTMDVLKTLF